MDQFKSYFCDNSELDKFLKFINGEYKGKVVVFIGTGSNGKSTISNFLEKKVYCRRIDINNVTNGLQRIENHKEDIKLLLTTEPYNYKNIVKDCKGFDKLIKFIEETNISCLMTLNEDIDFDKFEDKVIRIKFDVQFLDAKHFKTNSTDVQRIYSYTINADHISVNL